METGQKITRKINKKDPFSITNLTINIGYNVIGLILYDNIDNVLLDSHEITYTELANIDYFSFGNYLITDKPSHYWLNNNLMKYSGILQK